MNPDHDIKSTWAEAWYVRGMVHLTLYRKSELPNDLQDACHYLEKAVALDRKITGKKYWAFIHLLLTQHLRDRKTWDKQIVADAKTRLQEALNDPCQATRPTPRIYRLRLAAIELAARRSKFSDLLFIIEEDKTKLSGKLMLPSDFFDGFVDDCDSLFKHDLRTRDKVLSLIYDWAATVRKKT